MGTVLTEGTTCPGHLLMICQEGWLSLDLADGDKIGEGRCQDLAQKEELLQRQPWGGTQRGGTPLPIFSSDPSLMAPEFPAHSTRLS